MAIQYEDYTTTGEKGILHISGEPAKVAKVANGMMNVERAEITGNNVKIYFNTLLNKPRSTFRLIQDRVKALS